MIEKLRGRLTYANVTATLALFLALSGGMAWALANNSVKSRHIVNEQVKAVDVAPGAVTEQKLGDDSVTSAKVLGDSLDGTDLDEGTLRIPNFTPAGSAPPAADCNELSEVGGLRVSRDDSTVGEAAARLWVCVRTAGLMGDGASWRSTALGN